MIRQRTNLKFALATLLLWQSIPLTAEDGPEIFFEQKVRPLLLEHCSNCHGEKKQFGEFRLDSREALLKGGDNGPAIVPGKPAESRLMEAIHQTGDIVMPPEPAEKLSDEQIAILEKWIADGAHWPASALPKGDERERLHKTHWAFQPLARVEPPVVSDSTWCLTPIDHFVRARLDAAGFTPSPKADRRTLIRRVTYDLTGLPPTPAEVEAFVNDSDADAYPKLVERLLNSPHYGEHWARHWLDVARYSDTKGYVYAREERFWVHAPAYRDWVVNAFNSDLPYNRFLELQIAADQAAPNDLPARAAMGFLTLGRRFLGVNHDIIDDRIDVVTRGTMGMTVACARCHDHKYDPIPTADYYSLYGVFMNSKERQLQVGPPLQKNEAYAAFDQELQTRIKKLNETMLLRRNEASDRVRARIADYLFAQTELQKYPEQNFNQILAVNDIIPDFVRLWQNYLDTAKLRRNPIFLPWIELAALPPEEFSARASVVLGELAATPRGTVNSRVLTALTPPPTSIRETADRYGKLFTEISEEWKQLCQISEMNGHPKPTSLPLAESETLRLVMYGNGAPCVVPDEPMVTIEYFFDNGSCVELWKLQGDVDRWLIQSPLAPPFSTTLVDCDPLRSNRIFRRGNPTTKGDEVTRHFLTVVDGPNPSPFTQGSGRYELAQKIIAPSNPLTPRVWVNRVWQHHFGTGLVKTPSDFGIRAETPSHPELLDWLAANFMHQGWSTKQLHRWILLSNTYQQRSDAIFDLAQREQEQKVDPENRLLWRMNSHRLTFEEFRDTILAITGRLDLSLEGRAADLFSANGTGNRRRTLYGLVDRQFLPPVMRVFDFANPDLHIPQRSETTVPQQALFGMNHPLMAEQARGLIAATGGAEITDPSDRIRKMYRAVYQREPSAGQLEAAINFVDESIEDPSAAPRPETLAWQYGYGELDETEKRLKGFQPLPYFSGSAWQGGTQFPDGTLGWVQLTPQGGHTGNDLKHSAIRRWTAPRDGTYSVKSLVKHEVAEGDGIRCWIVSSRDGVLASAAIHNRQEELNLSTLSLKQGDTLDFVADLHANLNSEQHLWAPVITELTQVASTEAQSVVSATWDAERDFSGPVPVYLSRWEQLAQVLLLSNEMMFVD